MRHRTPSSEANVCSTRGLVAGDPLAQIEVVHQLLAVVVVLGLVGIVVADAGIGRDAVDDVAIRLKEREEPVVVFVAGIGADRQTKQPGAGVDVVSRRDDEPHLVRREHGIHRRGHGPLPACGRLFPDAGAIVAEHHERERS